MKIDGSMVGVGKLSSPLCIKVADGRIIEIEGKDKDKVHILLENERNATLGELGIGTNPAARLTGVILEDEKIYGTVHIAFGTNISFGGLNKADCHLDGVILKPTLYLDDILVLENGEFVI
jgi:leucyl aminopeptidase (aminopeptidase T)